MKSEVGVSSKTRVRTFGEEVMGRAVSMQSVDEASPSPLFIPDPVVSS